MPISVPRGRRPFAFDSESNADPGGAGDAHGAATLAAQMAPATVARLAPSLVPAPAAPGISPNFHEPIPLVASHTVPAGTLWYSQSVPYMFTTYENQLPQLGNAGTLWNKATASVVVYGMNFGYVFNSGLIVAEAPERDAQAIWVLSTFHGLFNYGAIYALADQSFAVTVREWSQQADIINGGLIAALSLRPDDGLIGSISARAVYRVNGGHVHNLATGQILAEGSAAIALALDRGHIDPPGGQPYHDVLNAGLIEARSLDPHKASIAVDLYSFGNEIMTVLNSGTIRSDVAILTGGQETIIQQAEKTITNEAGGLIDGAVLLSLFHEKLVNRGLIEGDIDMAGGSDLVLNFGNIVGDVDLGGGADIWFSPAGALQGAVFGGDGADSLFGSAGADTLNGEAGADVIRGSAGADRLNGGADPDMFVYDEIGDSTAAAFDTIAGFASGVDRIDLSALAVQSVSIQPGAGFATLSAATAAGTLVIRVEGALAQGDLILANISSATGTAGADTLHATAGGSTLSAGAGNDALLGGKGNDRLDGGAGDDMLLGGFGDDVYTVDSNLDWIRELDGQGRDTVEVYYHDYYHMPENVEDVVAFDPDFTYIYGNGLPNRMTGNETINTFIGGGGGDVILGGGGNDRLQGDSGGDRLTGGAGADLFIFTRLGDSRPGAVRSDGKKALPDIISDFTSGEDKIDLSAIDAADGNGWDDVFAFIGTNAFSRQSGELRYEVREGRAHIYGDVNGDGYADLHIIAVTPSLTAADFLL